MSTSTTSSENPLTLSKIISSSIVKSDKKEEKPKKYVSFKDEHSFEKRKAEADRIKEKYPDRIPIIVERLENSNVPDIDKKKYLVPSDLTMGQFVYVIRKRIKLPADQAIFIFVNNTLPPAAALVSQVYKEHCDGSGFLFVSYSGESTFGNI